MKYLPKVIDVLYPQTLNSKPEIAEMNTLYTDDSLHIASFVMKYQNALEVSSRDSINKMSMLHGIAAFYCRANNGGKLQD